MKPRLLDLFCGAGGAAMGYHRAGFEVVGIDINPQPHYPFEFFQADVLSPFTFLTLMTRLDAIHASPPCQRFTAYRRRGAWVGEAPDLIRSVRAMLKATELPYVIENVPGAPLRNAKQLCGSSFGLDIRRHRLFESNVAWPEKGCDHPWQTPRFPPATNRVNQRRTVEVGVWRIPLAEQKRAMGVDWDVTRQELSQMVPPAYTEFIGRQLLRALEMAA